MLQVEEAYYLDSFYVDQCECRAVARLFLSNAVALWPECDILCPISRPSLSFEYARITSSTTVSTTAATVRVGDAIQFALLLSWPL